jgi:glycerophosphoryl diester phosphodiesterase
LAAAYILATCCRKGHPGLAALRGWRYAHRGLHGNGVPENSLAAFRKALDMGYGIELDVHLLKDGSLAVLHDHSLKRTAGANVSIEDLTANDLQNYRLEGTQETIPLFSQVLELFAGQAPLIVELKSTTENYAALTQAAVTMLDSYRGAYCIESFDPRCIGWLKRYRPELIRGQLAENFFRSGSNMSFLLKLLMSWQLTHFLTTPDFVAFKYRDRKNIGTFLSRKFWGAQGVSWTLKSRQELDTAEKEGWLPIFEGFIP